MRLTFLLILFFILAMLACQSEPKCIWICKEKPFTADDCACFPPIDKEKK